MSSVSTPARERASALGLTVLVGAIVALVVWRGYLLIRSGSAVGVGIGLAVMAIAMVGGWLVWRTVRFGVRMQAMARELEAEGGLPADDLPRRPSGRAERAAADAVFEQRREDAERRPDDWRAWFRLALAYDDAGDRRRAREAARTAISLHRVR